METVRRNSKKRQSVYDALCAARSHPSAEQLYSLLKPQMPELSLGTVYRNLGVLLEEGRIISVGRVDGEERYDADTSSHPHFICASCGCVLDLPANTDLEGYCRAVEAFTQGKVFSCSVSFCGLCKDCETRQNATQE